MSEQTTTLTCPTCKGPITEQELARDGQCATCMDREFGTQPATSSPVPPQEPTPAEAADPSTLPTSNHEDGSAADASEAALAEILAGLHLIHEVSTTLNAKVYLLEGDDLANAVGRVFDACIAGAAGLLDVLIDDWRTTGVG